MSIRGSTPRRCLSRVDVPCRIGESNRLYRSCRGYRKRKRVQVPTADNKYEQAGTLKGKNDAPTWGFTMANES